MTTSRLSKIVLMLIVFVVAVGQLYGAAASISVATPATMTYVRGKGAGSGLQGSAPKITVTVTASATTDSTYVAVDTTTLPVWAILDKSNATVTGSTTTSFTMNPSPLATTLAPGTYSQSIDVKAIFAGGATSTKTITATIVVKNALSQIAATTPTISWKYGDTTLPTAKITVTPVDGDPIGFSASVVGVNPSSSWVSLSATAGIATSWGEDINLTFAQVAFDNAVKGTPLTATVTIKGPNNTVTVPISITVAAPESSIALDEDVPFIPYALPVVSSGTGVRTVAVQGTNFFSGMDVKVGSGAAIKNDCATFASVTAAQALCIQSSERFFLKLREKEDLASAATLTIHVDSASGSLTVTTDPIVYGVANSASLVEPTPGGKITVAPYQMITITGENFAKTGTAYLATPDGTTGRYPNSYTDGNAEAIKVSFSHSGDPLDKDPDAYLLSVTPSQIVALVPSTMVSDDTAVVDRGGHKSLDLTFTAAANVPGVFVNDDGSAVVLNNKTGYVNNSTNTAKATEDVTLYLAGMGAPTSAADPTGADLGSIAYPTSCVSPANYLTEVNTAQSATYDTMDGFALDATVAGSAKHYVAPCFDPADVTVKFGGTTATVKFAGWVAGDVAGLYTIVATVPALTGMTPTSTGAASYPVVVSVGGVDTQSGPFIWLK